jgi:hypothetical protein
MIYATTLLVLASIVPGDGGCIRPSPNGGKTPQHLVACPCCKPREPKGVQMVALCPDHHHEGQKDPCPDTFRPGGKTRLTSVCPNEHGRPEEFPYRPLPMSVAVREGGCVNEGLGRGHGTRTVDLDPLIHPVEPDFDRVTPQPFPRPPKPWWHLLQQV